MGDVFAHPAAGVVRALCHELSARSPCAIGVSL